MSMITELDVINDCLSTQGEAPLNSIDTDHPFVPAAQLKLMLAHTLVQGQGWYFNEDWTTLLPDPDDGTITVPKGTIKVLTAGNQYVVRGRRLWDRGNSSFNIAKNVECVLTMELPLEDLPMLWNNLVAARAVLEFQAGYDAEGEKYQKLLSRYNQLFIICKQEDIRQRKANIFNGGTVSYKLNKVRPLSRYSNNRGLGG